MQVLYSTRDVEKQKPQLNLAVPLQIKAAFTEVAKNFDRMEKGLVGSAAVLLLLQEDPETIQMLVRRVRNAKGEKWLEKLIAEAKSGRYRKLAMGTETPAEAAAAEKEAKRKDEKVGGRRNEAAPIAKKP